MTNGHTIYVPLNQEQSDTEETLTRDGLIRRDAGHLLVSDPTNVRVICWMLTVNADARRAGRAEVFRNLPGELYEQISDGVH